MTNLKYQIVKESVTAAADGQVLDAMVVNEHFIPIRKGQKIETIVFEGYRYIIVNAEMYRFHRTIHEIGRSYLLNEILDLMKAINTAMETAPY